MIEVRGFVLFIVYRVTNPPFRSTRPTFSRTCRLFTIVGRLRPVARLILYFVKALSEYFVSKRRIRILGNAPSASSRRRVDSSFLILGVSSQTPV